MGNKKFLIAIAVFCVVASAGMIVLSTKDASPTKGKKILLKCIKCTAVVEMEVDAYQAQLEELTKGMDQMALMSAQDLGLKCRSCSGLLRVAFKNPDTNAVEILGQ